GCISIVMFLFAVINVRQCVNSTKFLLSAAALTLGIGLRAWVDNSWLFLGLSVLGHTGIAVANVLMPAWIKIHARQHTVKLMTVYSVCVVAAGSLGAAATAPLAQFFSAVFTAESGWRAALSRWGIVALVVKVL